MALGHRTEISGLTVDRGGNAVLTLKLFIVDGSFEFGTTTHSFPIPKDTNLASAGAQINAILLENGRVVIPPRESSIIGQTLTACWAAMNA
jgi:hypothetical protein